MNPKEKAHPFFYVLTMPKSTSLVSRSPQRNLGRPPFRGRSWGAMAKAKLAKLDAAHHLKEDRTKKDLGKFPIHDAWHWGYHSLLSLFQICENNEGIVHEMFAGIVCIFGNASQAWNCRCTVIFRGDLIMDWLGGVVKMGDAPSSCHFGTTLSRKLASASWSPSCISCFSKYGGSWNLTSHETPTLFLLFFGSYGRKIPCPQCWWKVGSVGLLLKKNSVLNMI